MILQGRHGCFGLRAGGRILGGGDDWVLLIVLLVWQSVDLEMFIAVFNRRQLDLGPLFLVLLLLGGALCQLIKGFACNPERGYDDQGEHA